MITTFQKINELINFELIWIFLLSTQTYENGKWIKKSSVEEIYPEGCQKSGDGSEYCHCRGSLCNSATKLNDSKMSYHTDAMAVIFVFNLMKYIKNMEFY